MNEVKTPKKVLTLEFSDENYNKVAKALGFSKLSKEPCDDATVKQYFVDQAISLVMQHERHLAEQQTRAAILPIEVL